MAGISPGDIAKAERILESVRDEWMERPGVVAIDLGFRWSKGEMTSELSIRVHVAEKKPSSQLSTEELFPDEIKGIRVDIIEAVYVPQALSNSKLESAVDGRDKRYEVIPVGVSIGSRYSTAGTLGAKVVDIKTGDEMILSNWHVLAGRPGARPGLPIWQPGWIDGGTKEDNTIAELSRWVLGPFDAAVAKLNGNRVVTTKTLEGRSIVDVTEPRLGMRVWKSGRSTGYTEGFIDGIKMRVSIPYGELGVKRIDYVFHVVPRPGAEKTEISMGGDSGAVWVDEESGKAVGLHFAGERANLPEHALANEIIRVTKALNIRFLSQPPPRSVKLPIPRRMSNTALLDAITKFLRRLFRTR
jgi:hypothetical protein